MCKILMVVITFLWALANSTFPDRDSLPLVLISNCKLKPDIVLHAKG